MRPEVTMLRWPSAELANSMNAHAAALLRLALVRQYASAWRMPARCLRRGSGATSHSKLVIVR